MIIKTIHAVIKASVIGLILCFTIQPVYADVDVTYVVGASGSYGCTFGPNIPTCPAGFDAIIQNSAQTICTANNVVSSKRITGLNSCPINLSAIPNPRQSDRFTELANTCEAHRIANGATFLFNQPSPGGVTAVTSCNVVNVAGVWEDTRVVTACNADCIQTVEQRNSVSGETRIIERACDVGQGQCLITSPAISQPSAPEVDLITDNPTISAGTYEFSTAQATQSLCARLLTTDSALLSAKTIDLRDRCRDLTLESNDLLQLRGVQNLSAEELASRATISKQQYQAQLSNVNSRLAAIRPALFNASRNIARQSTRPPKHQLADSLQTDAHLSAQANTNRQIGAGVGGGAGDDDASRLGVFFTGTRSDGATEATLLATEYNYDSKSYTFGADYLINPSTILGAAIGYGSSDVDIDAGAGHLASDSLAFSFYGSHYLGENWFVDGVLGYGQTDYENSRNISYIANAVAVNQLANSNSDSSQWFLSLGVGTNINRMIDVDLSARFNYLRVGIDRFSETVSDSAIGSGLALEIDEQTLESITSDISIRLSKPYGVAYGVLVPFISLN